MSVTDAAQSLAPGLVSDPRLVNEDLAPRRQAKASVLSWPMSTNPPFQGVTLTRLSADVVAQLVTDAIRPSA
ncbi:hypothetical protein OG758_42480 [Streptomyces sp. NBC_01474]|uniref:hypothetical protein n=1 Tax=Streptomyces sp. NBC_01474 TaxID=2903880 RepID=UPI002DD84906|nr:hypothetical protein [Streptomyces sp. NBC_01474]WSE00261.1 hypothetical protein OG758_42480 [Streptomyces sp. NBC_01474]